MHICELWLMNNEFKCNWIYVFFLKYVCTGIVIYIMHCACPWRMIWRCIGLEHINDIIQSPVSRQQIGVGGFKLVNIIFLDHCHQFQVKISFSIKMSLDPFYIHIYIERTLNWPTTPTIVKFSDDLSLPRDKRKKITSVEYVQKGTST